MFLRPFYTITYPYASARCKRPSVGSTHSDGMQPGGASVQFHSSGTNLLDHGHMVSILAAAVGGESVYEIQMLWNRNHAPTHEAIRP